MSNKPYFVATEKIATVHVSENGCNRGLLNSHNIGWQLTFACLIPKIGEESNLIWKPQNKFDSQNDAIVVVWNSNTVWVSSHQCKFDIWGLFNKGSHQQKLPNRLLFKFPHPLNTVEVSAVLKKVHFTVNMGRIFWYPSYCWVINKGCPLNKGSA